MAINPAKTLIPILFMLVVLIPICKTAILLYGGQQLNSGESLENGNYILRMQKDCNLVLYDNGNQVWSSGTGALGRNNCYCPMQTDGNLVVYAKGDGPIWASNTGKDDPGDYVLILQDDRNVRIFGHTYNLIESSSEKRKRTFFSKNGSDVWSTDSIADKGKRGVDVVNGNRGVTYVTKLNANTTSETILRTNGTPTAV